MVPRPPSMQTFKPDPVLTVCRCTCWRGRLYHPMGMVCIFECGAFVLSLPFSSRLITGDELHLSLIVLPFLLLCVCTHGGSNLG